MKILIADKFPESGVSELKAAGFEVVYDAELKDESLTQAVSSTGADVLVVRGTKVPGATLEAGRLSLVVRAGAGYNTIDVKTASARDVLMKYEPGLSAASTSSLMRLRVSSLRAT